MAKKLRLQMQSQQRDITKPINIENANNMKRAVRLALAVWINTPALCEEQFYPLHFASFNGNVKLLKLLTKNGADIMARNSQGIDMLHVAA
jgi:hypothetical protein